MSHKTNLRVKGKRQILLKSAKIPWYLSEKHFTSRAISVIGTADKTSFPIKNFLSKCKQICMKLRICPHLLKKSLTEILFFCAGSILEHLPYDEFSQGESTPWRNTSYVFF